MEIKPLHIFLALCLSFLVYSFSIYTNKPTLKQPQTFNTELAIKGRLVWQKYNCQSCHQLYGLGGYLGPDLTNIYSLKGDKVISGIINSGVKAMPAFNLSEEEQTALLEFLIQTNQSGTADYRKFKKFNNGMIEQP